MRRCRREKEKGGLVERMRRWERNKERGGEEGGREGWGWRKRR